MAQDKRKAELIAELDAARSRLATHAHGLHGELDLAARARKAFARNPFPWIGGASVAGLLIARLFRRQKTVVVERRGEAAALGKAGKAGLLLGALKIAFDVARPALGKWLVHRVSEYVNEHGKSDRFSQ
jgi:hypothetical protein